MKWWHTTVFCDNTLETRDHVLLLCPFAQQLWRLFYRVKKGPQNPQLWRLYTRFFNSPPLPNSLGQLFLQWNSTEIRMNLRLVLDELATAICWLLWRERNMRGFQNTAKNYVTIFADALFFVHFWTGPAAKKKKDKIMSVVEMLSFPPIWQADGALPNQLDYGGNSVWKLAHLQSELQKGSHMIKFPPIYLLESWYKSQEEADKLKLSFTESSWF